MSRAQLTWANQNIMIKPMVQHIQIKPLDPTQPELRAAAAAMLVAGFREHWPRAWPDHEAALQEVDECLLR